MSRSPHQERPQEDPKIEPPTEYRRCSHCFDQKPIKKFRPRRGGRHGICNDCHCERERERRAAKRLKRIDQYAAKIKNCRDNVAVRAATAAMVARMGGVDQLVVAFHEQFEAAQREHPGGRVAMNCILAIFRLIEACSAFQPVLPNVKYMSDEDLEKDLARLLNKEIEEEVTRRILELGFAPT